MLVRKLHNGKTKEKMLRTSGATRKKGWGGSLFLKILCMSRSAVNEA